MGKGWVRVREAAALLQVSESTVRRRIAEGQLRGRTGASGRREVFLSAKSRVQSGSKSPRESVRSAAGHAESIKDASATATATSEQGRDTEPDSVSSLRDLSDRKAEDLVKRYERLAGGSLMLAQQRADDLTQAANAAYENLAHTRDQLRRLRKVALTGWLAAGVFLVVTFILALMAA